MAAYDDLNTKRIFNVGIASVVITAVTALAVQVVYYWMLDAQTAETQAASNYGRQLRILSEQENEISTYRVDPDTGNIVIPVSVEMALMAKESKKEVAGEET